MTERIDNLMRCVINKSGECLAKVPEACQCRRMPLAVIEEYEDAVRRSMFVPAHLTRPRDFT